ncbi:GAF domain-containing protein [Pseudoalteromonas sp. MEBiC 03607]|jgi:GAF domain-containing protein|uniref:GAF domain-containing protein n=1 Tax=unclassified Pseudoalteromonas TaxID=194690 RepID=UPI000C3E1406|nr:GAF domain-containing protein [Pseudoalteromonas sp. MEBiC 03607]MBD57634.1 histidine kinase [Pseudoalteromonas sp.]TGV17112.1 GAF domain-containing protein [Pseudoalteromonas sp. MEBiC 03607]|tara:strand:- start:1433 stop:1915 length:483 start_codon:yes stop_codon:yes gene_type:complete
MKVPIQPENETLRLEYLNSLNLLDSEENVDIDRITDFIAKLFCVPIALVSIVDSHRQWFKSKVGLDVCETPRDISFCGHAILDTKPLIVTNALFDERFLDNPLVTGEPYIRFYAGAPLIAKTGVILGTLCIIDTQPRDFSENDTQILVKLASDVMQLIEN